MYAHDYIDPGTPASDAAPQVTLEIDGVGVTVPEGTSIMRAASMMGTQIPKLCATGTLKAFGSCRLCLVQIEGRNGYPGVVHDCGCARHEGAHAERKAHATAPQRG